MWGLLNLTRCTNLYSKNWNYTYDKPELRGGCPATARRHHGGEGVAAACARGRYRGEAVARVAAVRKWSDEGGGGGGGGPSRRLAVTVTVVRQRSAAAKRMTGGISPVLALSPRAGAAGCAGEQLARHKADVKIVTCHRHRSRALLR